MRIYSPESLRFKFIFIIFVLKFRNSIVDLLFIQILINDCSYPIHLTPERKKNMGMFHTSMLMVNQRATRCQRGMVAGSTFTYHLQTEPICSGL